MCSISLKQGECFNTSCELFHIRGTKRNPPSKKHEITVSETVEFSKDFGQLQIRNHDIPKRMTENSESAEQTPQFSKYQ